MRGLGEELLGFLGGKAQILGADFGHLLAGAQARQGQGRVCAGGEDPMKIGRVVIQAVFQRLVNFGAVDDMVIVQHQTQRLLEGGQFVEPGIQHGRRGGAARHLQKVLRAAAQAGILAAQGGDGIA